MRSPSSNGLGTTQCRFLRSTHGQGAVGADAVGDRSRLVHQLVQLDDGVD